MLKMSEILAQKDRQSGIRRTNIPFLLTLLGFFPLVAGKLRLSIEYTTSSLPLILLHIQPTDTSQMTRNNSSSLLAPSHVKPKAHPSRHEAARYEYLRQA